MSIESLRIGFYEKPFTLEDYRDGHITRRAHDAITAIVDAFELRTPEEKQLTSLAYVDQYRYHLWRLQAELQKGN